MAAVTVLLWTQLCLCCAREIGEDQLYQSEEWEDSSRPLIFTKPGQSQIQHAISFASCTHATESCIHPHAWQAPSLLGSSTIC